MQSVDCFCEHNHPRPAGVDVAAHEAVLEFVTTREVYEGTMVF